MVEISHGKVKCVLCGEPLPNYITDSDEVTYTANCGFCGKYKWLKNIEMKLSQLDFGKRLLLSGRSRELNETERVLALVSEDIVDEELRSVPKDMLEKIDRLLLNLVARSGRAGHNLTVSDHEYSLGYCQRQHEFEAELELLEGQGLLRHHWGTNVFNIKLTAEGYKRAKDLRANLGLLSGDAFVAMWFDDRMDELWTDGLQPAIRQVGFNPIRLKGLQHNDRIDSLIIYHIKKSRSVVADVTGNRSAVYYEAGFAHGLERAVIWTCNSKKKSDACFDTRQYNHIFWDSPEQLKEELRDRILGTVGEGPGPR